MAAAATAQPEQTEYVKLISHDQFVFVLDKKIAIRSGTIRTMLSGSGQFTESLNNEITFRNISSTILEKVCQYLHYNYRYSTPALGERDIPEFPIEPEYALELLMTANFLDV
jgi:transcription elongation factor B subunit 1